MQEDRNWIDQDPENAMTLPSRYCYDEGLFQQEKERIFMKAWHVIGHKNELSEAGQYIVSDFFDQSIIAVCGNDGEVHAFHNVCQHRGNRLVEGRRGKVESVFRCSYHGWCYNHDGTLRGAPRSKRVKGFKTENFRCPAVRVEELGGFLYFNLDQNVPSLIDLFPGAEKEIRGIFSDLDDMHLIEESDVIVPANWKVIMDNSVEGYHFTLSGKGHFALCDLIDFSGYTLRQHDYWWTYFGPSDLSVKAPYGAKFDKPPDPDDRFFNIGLFPHNTFYRFPFADFLGTFIMIPLGPEKSLLRFGYYSSLDPLPAVTKASIEWMNNCLGPEDIALNVSTQKGLRSMGYNQGRYMIDEARSNESEHLVHHFHTLVYKALHGSN